MPTHLINIKKVLLDAIATSKHSIEVAVAYFNDSDLIAAITAKQKSGVQVRVLVGQSENLNLGLFQEFISKGGKVVVAKQDKGIMHIKLSIFDKEKAFLGSYNWTFGATYNNKEMLYEVTAPSEVKIQAEHFENLWNEYTDKKITQDDLNTLFTRLDLIRNFAFLAEWNNVNEHLEKVLLNSSFLLEGSFELLRNLSDAVNQKNRDKISELISQIKTYQGQLSQFQTGEESLLKIHIQWYQQQIKSLNQLYAEQEEIICSWDKRVFLNASDLLRKLYTLKTELAKIRMQASQKKESKAAYEKAQMEQEAFENEKLDFQKPNVELSESEGKLLKELYRKATSLCHPDRADQSDPESIKIATEFMVLVNIAYANKDLNTLKQLLIDLENGVGVQVNMAQFNIEERIYRLKTSLNLLNQEYLSLLSAIDNQIQQPSFINASTCKDFEEWLKSFKLQLQSEIKVLEKDIERFQ